MRAERPTTDMRNRVQHDREKRKEQKAKHKKTKAKYSNLAINIQAPSNEEIERIKSKITADSYRLKKKNQLILGVVVGVLLFTIIVLTILF